MAATALRTHRVGSLTREQLGQEVRLGGWVHRRRDLGGLVFVDLRDRAGLVQLSFNPEWTPSDILERAAGLGAETVVLVTGKVALRPEPSKDQQAPVRSRCGRPVSRLSVRRRRLRYPLPAKRRKSFPRRSYACGIACSTSVGPNCTGT
jgi:aspartyl-tRNA synthetase